MIRATLLTLSLLAGATAHAGAYPWIALGEEDVRVIEDPKVEINLRMNMIRSATSTIDIANYDQRAEPHVALPMATALRDAADRGVRVRIMVSWSTTVLFDYHNRFGELLVDPPTRTPIEYLIVGGPVAQDEGRGMFEGIHQKFCIVDGTTLMTTGRGFAEVYLWWLDTAFAMRGPLVQQAAHSYDVAWREARARHMPYAGYLGGPRQSRAPRYELTAATALDAAQRALHDDFVAWLSASPAPALALAPRGRLLYHDFLRQMRGLGGASTDFDLDQRIELLADPIVDAAVVQLATARSVRMAFISTILHPKLRAALLAARRRGAEITLFVNTAPPRLSKDRARIVPSGSVWAHAIADADELLAAGVRIFGFQVKTGSPWLYLHRKLAIFDDTVIFGSHNFNVPSSAFFDEASFEITSPGLAARLRAIFDADLAKNGELFDVVKVRHERDLPRTRLIRWMTATFLEYM